MRERAQPGIQPFGQPRILVARVAGIDDYNRLHQNELSHLPGVIRLETSFALGMCWRQAGRSRLSYAIVSRASRQRSRSPSCA